jgi:hypothetical protein
MGIHFHFKNFIKLTMLALYIQMIDFIYTSLKGPRNINSLGEYRNIFVKADC